MRDYFPSMFMLLFLFIYQLSSSKNMSIFYENHNFIKFKATK